MLPEEPLLQEHKTLWNKAKDSYLLSIIDNALNRIPLMKNPNHEQTPVNLNFELPKNKSIAEGKSKVIHFPLSSANCGTINGNIQILQNFVDTLGLKPESPESVFVFDPQKKTYNLEQTRERQYFLDRVTRVLNKKPDDDGTLDDVDADGEEETPDASKQEDFQTYYRSLRQKLWNSSALDQFILTIDPQELSEMKDMYGRSLLHEAVERNHRDMVELIFNVGFNPNVQENCGITPLCICVILENLEMAELLIKCGAQVDSTIPSAIDIAKNLDKNVFIEKFKIVQEDEVNNLSKLFSFCSKEMPVAESDTQVTGDEGTFNFCRESSLIPVFGDNGVEKLIRSVKLRSGKFSNFCECPGDLHAFGYACECMAKTLGPGGMYYCLKTVLKRKNNEETFGQKKFQDGNYFSNLEACRDIAMGYGLAAFEEFTNSSYFPNEDECISSGQDKSVFILKRFKLFLKDISTNTNCQYYVQAILLFGPWLMVYRNSIRQGSGLGRELAWVLSLYVYSQLKKTNYSTSALVHCVNFLYAWPLLTREIVRNYFFVNVKGRKNHNMALDEYVESHMVKPLKVYATGHTSFRILQLLSVSTQLMKHVHDSYQDTFDFAGSRSHKVPDSLPDQVKISEFALQHKFFSKQVQHCKAFNDNGPTDKNVQAKFTNIYESGKAVNKSKFPSKMYSNFPEWRQKLAQLNGDEQ